VKNESTKNKSAKNKSAKGGTKETRREKTAKRVRSLKKIPGAFVRR
jgi:hypothetical protein